MLRYHGGTLQRAVDYLNAARCLVSGDPPKAVGICRMPVKAVDKDLSDQGYGTVKVGIRMAPIA